MLYPKDALLGAADKPAGVVLLLSMAVLVGLVIGPAAIGLIVWAVALAMTLAGGAL